ncbi:hypothetical protein [Planctomicrobium piriforme]|uniref:Phage abortive infection protein n=1 Tax=Planctomicrobium piriforme TaxID=1576369 RepID=A0A1I3L6K2_9PLAN|nr:hypothetical protein [Planctomicrobium piriforme]SFI80299.1 hypothetical protein SAMN05421753_112154 [Planctomicrobium piriforme]
MSEAQQSDIDIVVRWAKKHVWWIGTVFVVLCLIPYVPIIVALLFSKSQEWRVINPNEFGDSFGFLNAVMSSLAFGGVLFTVFLQDRQLRKQDQQLDMQREELGLQREEMKESRTELKRSADAQKEMIEMQLCQSYLAAQSALLQHYASADGGHDAQKVKRSVDPLEDVIDRIGSHVGRIIARQPVDRVEFWQRLEGRCRHILGHLKLGRRADAVDLNEKLIDELKRWIPGFDGKDSITESFIANDLLPTLVRIRHLERDEPCDVEKERLQIICSHLSAMIVTGCDVRKD